MFKKNTTLSFELDAVMLPKHHVAILLNLGH